MPAEPTAALEPDDLRAWGIEPGYRDVFDRWQVPGAEAVARLRRAMGAQTDDPAERPPATTPLTILRPGQVMTLGSPAVLTLEDGTVLTAAQATPPDLPLGYHRLEAETTDGLAVTNLIVSPGRAVLPPDLRTWGLTMQLYAARSRRSWGLGDLADLRRIIGWAAARGAGVIGVNPLHANDPFAHQVNSPYSPSSRRWRNPLYLAIEEVPGAASLPDYETMVAQGRSLNHSDRIDRDAVWRLKRAALAHLWSAFGGDPAFDRYRSEQGHELATWATYCALADHHGCGWRQWPAEHRRPDAPGVEAFARDHVYEIGFWAWLQWLIDEQLAASGAPQVMLADLAVGFDANGADAWQWQDLLAPGVRIGAPPDLLGPAGQDWGLPPFVPWKLRAAAYGPIAATLRAVCRHARGIRIDHVMGLFRLLWIPPDMDATHGAYVRFTSREFLEVVALESARTGVLVVGEDLGTVEPGIRDILADAGVLSTRLLWFEDAPPINWPHQALSAITTHDLPTVAGVWTGADLADQRSAGVTVPPGADADLRARLADAAHASGSTPVDEVVVGAHRTLAESPSMIVTATLDDLVGAVHRPNLPGTVDQHPNWRLPLSVALDDLGRHPLAEAVAAALRTGLSEPARPMGETAPASEVEPPGGRGREPH